MLDIKIVSFLLLVSLLPVYATESKSAQLLQKNKLVLSAHQQQQLREALTWKFINEAAHRCTYFIHSPTWIPDAPKKFYDTFISLQESLYQERKLEAKQTLLTTFCNLIEIPTINIQEVLKDNSDIQNHK